MSSLVVPEVNTKVGFLLQGSNNSKPCALKLLCEEDVVQQFYIDLC